MNAALLSPPAATQPRRAPPAMPEHLPVLHDALPDLRLALPSLPLAAAAAARVAFDTRCPALLSRYLGNATVRIGRRQGLPPGLRVALSSLAGDVVLELDPRRCTAWALLDRLARKPHQQALACALAGEMIDRASRARGFQDVGLEVRSLVSSDASRPPATSVATVRIDDHEVELLEMDPAFSLFAAEEMRERPVAVPAELRAWQLPGVAQLGERTLSAHQWATVARGDVFLLEQPPLTLRWRIGAGRAWRATARLSMGDALVSPAHQLQALTLTLETAPARAEEHPPMDTPMDSALPGTLPEIDLPVQFELQTASLPLEEIAALGPGQVVALDVPVDQAVVQLMCQGRRVGSGQLVVVGDHLGVRIDRMAWARDAAADR
jgi:type III secretion protein Q